MSSIKGFIVKDSVKVNDFEEKAVAHARVAVMEGCRKYDNEKKEYVSIEGRSPMYFNVESGGTKEVAHQTFEPLQNSKNLIEFTGSLSVKSFAKEHGTVLTTPFMSVSKVEVLQKKNA